MRPSSVVAEPGIACEGIRSLPEGNTAQPLNPAVAAIQNSATDHHNGQVLGLSATGVGSEDNLGSPGQMRSDWPLSQAVLRSLVYLSKADKTTATSQAYSWPPTP